MTTHMDLLPNFDGKTALKEELGSLKRLVSQLLDNARIDALRIAPADQVDLNTLAADVAVLPRPLCHRRRKKHRSLQVRASCHRQWVLRFPISRASQPCGERRRAYAARHLRLYRRDEPRHAYRRRLRPGHTEGRARSHIRALLARRPGPRRRRRLGMAIISRTVAAHGGKIEIGDRRGGGALFKVSFPPFGAAGHGAPPSAHAPAARRGTSCASIQKAGNDKQAANTAGRNC